MPLNLTTGRNLPELYARESLPDWVLDIEDRYKQTSRLLERISERYFSVYGSCFIETILDLVYEEDGTAQYDFGEFVFTTDWTVPEARVAPIEQVLQCLERSRAVKLIAIIVGVRKHGSDVGHAQLLIINKVHRTIELYDPNGSSFIRDEYPGHLETLQNIFHDMRLPLNRYTFVPVTWTNSPSGLQVYQDGGTEACYDIGGFCSVWVFYYAELRARRVYDSPRTFRRKMSRRIKRLSEAGINLGKYFRDVILDYLMEMGRL